LPSEKPERTIERLDREKMQKEFLKGLSNRSQSHDRSKGELSAYSQSSAFRTRPHLDDGGYESELEAAVETADGEIRMVSELPEEYEEAEFKAVVESFNKAESRSNAFQSRPQQFAPGRGGMRPPSGRFSQGRGAGASGGSQPARSPVCYYNAIHGKCETGKDCPFSHDPTLAREWLQSKMKIYQSSPLLTAGQQSSRPSDPNSQQRYPTKKPDALYQMSQSHFPLSQQPSTGGASAGGEDEDED
jgi:hypothetical protein